MVFVKAERPELYDPGRPHFGQCVHDAFPSAIKDIEAVGCCLSLGLNDAAVCYLCSVIQIGLLATGKHLHARVNLDKDGWEDIIGKLQGGVNKKRASYKTKARWKAVEAFYEELLSDARHLKNAWRNPTLHFRRWQYTDDDAVKVWGKTRAFIQHVAKRIQESGAKAKVVISA